MTAIMISKEVKQQKSTGPVPVAAPAPLAFCSSSKRFIRFALLPAIFCLAAFCWLARLQEQTTTNSYSYIRLNAIMFANKYMTFLYRSHMCATHSLVRGGDCLWVSGRDHEADSRGSNFMSTCILHIPFGPIVPEQSVPLPTHNLSL